jgi:hypothetical protein
MFLAPLFLLGLLAIGVPLWLHRVARANPEQRVFPSLMLLEASETQRTAKRTLRYWLLLLARIAMLIALVVAFANPIWRERAGAASETAAHLHAIVLDASLSMQQGERWPQAIATARELIDNLGGSDRVMLVHAAGRRMEIVHEPIAARERAAVLAALNSLTPSLERTDFGFLMSSAEQWLGASRPAVALHLISDFQRSGAPLRFADLEPPRGARLFMHSVGERTSGNAYIESIAFGIREAGALDVVLRSDFTEPQSRTLVLLIDGKEAAQRSVVLAASERSDREALVGEGTRPVPPESSASEGTADVRGVGAVAAVTYSAFEDLVLSPGAHRIEVRLEPQDALPQDDRFFAVVEHADPKALLLSASEDEDAAAYFAAAVGALSAPRIAAEHQSAAAFASESLADYSVVVIPDAFALSSAVARRVEQFVQAGGAVLMSLGSTMREGAAPLLPTWTLAAPRPRLATIGHIETSHPAVRGISEWQRVRFFRQRTVRIDADDRVLIAYEDGEPLLVERALGAGRLLILTAPIDRDWNDLAIHPAFVQFIAQATRYLAAHDAAAASTTVGTAVTTGLTRASGGQIFDPSGERVLDLAAMQNTDRLLPAALGFYEIRHANGTRWLAVNTDRRESDLEPLAPAYLARWQALQERAAPPEARETSQAQATESVTRALGSFVLWLAALLVLAEILLANRYLATRRSVGAPT